MQRRKLDHRGREWERFVLVDYGREMRSITTTPQPFMVTTVAQRIGIW
ncbi:hypothetical protein [Povalibacter sp.]